MKRINLYFAITKIYAIAYILFFIFYVFPLVDNFFIFTINVYLLLNAIALIFAKKEDLNILLCSFCYVLYMKKIEQQLKLLDYLIDYYKEERYQHDPVCFLIQKYARQRNEIDDKFISKPLKFLPQFKKYKPKDRNKIEIWFSLDREGIQKRIDILTEIQTELLTYKNAYHGK